MSHASNRLDVWSSETEEMVNEMHDYDSEATVDVGSEDLAEAINRDSQSLVPVGEFETALGVEHGSPVRVVVETQSETGFEKEALLSFQFFDENGEVLENPLWRNVSKTMGEYQYLQIPSAGDRIAEVITLIPPEGATDLYLRGVQWDDRGRTVVNCVVETDTENYPVLETSYGTPLAVRSSQYFATQVVENGGGSVRTKLTISAGEELATCPLSVSFLDGSGNELIGNGDLPQNPRFGSFIPLDPDRAGLKTVEIEFTVPAGATRIEFRGIDWGAKSCTIHGSPEFEELISASELLNDFIDRVNHLEALFVIDTTAPPIGHDTLALRPNNLARAYADLGIGVIFFPFGSLQGYRANVSENVIQFERDQFDLIIDHIVGAEITVPKVYICSSFPSLQSCTTAIRLKAAGWQVLYECRDDMEEFNRVGYSKWYHPQLERRMIANADLIVSVSPDLDKKLQSLVPSIENNFVVPNGVNDGVIEDGAQLYTEAVLNQRNDSNTFGYVGHLTESWFDWSTLLEAANKLPQATFEIVGHGMPSGLSLPENVNYLGPKTHSELLPIVQHWRAGLIPFADLPLTRSVDPNKIYEYQAWGLRCISAPMGMVDRYPSTWVYRGVTELVACIRDVLETPITEEEVSELRTFVASCTWLERARNMRELVKAGLV